jgi:integrase/recombinase XerC
MSLFHISYIDSRYRFVQDVIMSNAMTVKQEQAVTVAINSQRLIADFFGGKSAKTIAAYRQDLETFAAHLGAETVESAADMLITAGQGGANAMALEYRNALTAAGKSPATVNRRLAALRSLIKLANTLGIVAWQLNVQSVKAESYRDTRGPAVEQVACLMTALDSSEDSLSARDAAIIRLLFNNGLRRGEVVELDFCHLNLAAATLSIKGKGRTYRETVTLAPQTVEALSSWIAVRGTAEGPLFTSTSHNGTAGNRLSTKAIERICKGRGSVAGIESLNPHALRHSAITNALDNGINVYDVAKFSRHKNIQTIKRYDDNRRDVAGMVTKLIAL